MSTSQLDRRLSLPDAFHIGVASMVGAGVFAVFAPAAQAAGAGLLIGLVLAAVVAWCNATSSAQLAVQFPVAGGTYHYGREMLGRWPGYLAGWSFIVGKTASCAAMAMVFASYLVPEPWQKPVAIAAVWSLVAINYRGVTRTALAARILVVMTLGALAVTIVVGWADGGAATLPVVRLPEGGAGWYGVLQSAGLLFFAFAGYARIATMGEEVRDPRRTIPRAIVGALLFTLLLYVLVAVTLLSNVPVAALANAVAPLMLLVEAYPFARVALTIGAVAASGGALLGLLTGIGRTWLAMARNDDLPRCFAVTHPRFKVPHRAELVLGALLTAIVLVADVRGAIGFSSFGVLLYYVIANLSALRQEAGHRRYSRSLQVVGAGLCLILVATLPWHSILAGSLVVLVGVVLRLVTGRRGHGVL